MFLKNKNIFFKIRRSKVTDYAALIAHCIFSDVYSLVIFTEFLQVSLEPDHTACARVSLAKQMVPISVQLPSLYH